MKLHTIRQTLVDVAGLLDCYRVADSIPEEIRDDHDEIAQRVYDLLRKIDQENPPVIPPPQRVGLGV